MNKAECIVLSIVFCLLIFFAGFEWGWAVGADYGFENAQALDSQWAQPLKDR